MGALGNPGITGLGEGESVTLPIRILFTIPNFITAGSGGAMLNIIRRLDREVFDPAVCVLKKGGALDQVVIDLGMPLLEAPFLLNAKPYSSLLKRIKRAAQVFAPYHFDLWHSFHYADDYTEPLIARFAGAKGWIYTKKNMNWNTRAWYLRSWFAKRIAAQNTDMLASFFSNDVYRDKTRLIPRGVDLQKFSPSIEGRFREHCGLADHQILIGCVAHLVPVKGHPTLIQALSTLPETHLVLAGRDNDQEYANRLREQVATLKLEERVHFLGMVENVPELMRDLDILILPTISKGEGCPVALLEAMACGKACVATNIPGARDIIEDGVSGLLVEPENADALTGAIRQLIDDNELRKKMGRAARVRVEEHFSIEKEVVAHEELYKEIMTGKTTRRET